LEKIYKILISVIGAVFIISGTGKALGLPGFLSQLDQYQIPYIRYPGIFLVLFEFWLGLKLLLQDYKRIHLRLAMGLVLAATMVYTYGLFFKEMPDCGCFGVFDKKGQPPLILYLRNAIIFSVLLMQEFQGYAWITKGNLRYKSLIITALTMSISFFAGLSYSGSIAFRSHSGKTEKSGSVLFSDTPVGKEFNIKTDSLTLLFVFSSTCDYCVNSIENIKKFRETGFVGKVVGIINRNITSGFKDSLAIDFPVYYLDKEILKQQITAYPTTYFIKNDTIHLVLQSQVPSPFVLIRRNKAFRNITLKN
jgi:hypothetical protein